MSRLIYEIISAWVEISLPGSKVTVYVYYLIDSFTR
jgi:hypothetical protein